MIYLLLRNFFIKAGAVTDAWYNEVADYDFNNAGFSSTTGHFTQVVWKGTTSVGAAYALTADGLSAYAVAQYAPPGNYEGLFSSNVIPKNKC